MATKSEISWAAGLFEGEGHIGWSNQQLWDRGHTPLARLILGMTDEDTVRRFHAVIGCGRINEKKTHRTSKPWHKKQWIWEARSWEDVTATLNLLLPWLCERRTERALEILERGALARECSCSVCGGPMEHGRSDKKFCGEECKYRASRTRHGLPTSIWHERPCSHCGVTYLAGRGGAIGYCSRRCRYLARRQREGHIPASEGVI